MLQISSAFVLCAAVLGLQAQGSPLEAPAAASKVSRSTASYPVSVALGGKTYINQGLVGFGYIPSNTTDTTGDTIGGIGSAIAFKPGTWAKSWSARGSNTYRGTLVVQPDRGYNIISTVNYQARIHEYDIVFTPYYGSKNLSYNDAAKTLQLAYKRTVLHYDRGHVNTTGLDPIAVRPASSTHFPHTNSYADPPLPIVSKQDQRLTIDAEGLVMNNDGTHWTSDEYGPYVYRFSAQGDLLQAIAPVDAMLPRNQSGGLNFTAAVDPTTGRASNKGLEGLTFDPATQRLYGLMQSALIQDGGGDKSTARYTRLIAWDVSNAHVQPPVVGEWVVPLPQTSKGKALPSSEVHFLGNGVFLALPRDSNGRGGDSPASSYKQADLFDISNATNIFRTSFDAPSGAVAPNGKLNASVTPAAYQGFINYLDDGQLARFGLHNGAPDDSTLIDSKWESFALVSAEDWAHPNDYFLFTASDNDFQTTHGVSVGQPYNAGIDVDNQFLVFRLTLPAAHGSTHPW
ncbi:hypothetical protein PLICRDRAFT_178703 [Plicaturopsis crispa FD-325 SS-3]|nr:hypothetical protein PLICRDRAFT_178703 [Plicaturopsis crispa FD-325 SS-3]